MSGDLPITGIGPVTVSPVQAFAVLGADPPRGGADDAIG